MSLQHVTSKNTPQVSAEKQKILEGLIDFFRDVIDPVETDSRSGWDFFTYIKNEEQEITEAMQDEDAEHTKEEMGDFVVMKIRFLLSSHHLHENSTKEILQKIFQEETLSEYISKLQVHDLQRTKEKFLHRYSFLSNPALSSFLQNLGTQSRRLVIESLYYWQKSTEENRGKIQKIIRSDFPISQFSIPHEFHTYFYECVSVLAKHRGNIDEAFCLGLVLFGGTQDFIEATQKMFSAEYKKFMQDFFSCSHIDTDEYILFFEYKKLHDFAPTLPMADISLLITQMSLHSQQYHTSLQGIITEITREPLRENALVFNEISMRIYQIGKTAKRQSHEFHQKFLQTLLKK
ncbi:hypothetical protein CSB09_02165 [Candidatus Gracilibacteria bacterium]|nr:MAG: hypothetical protein CSB09_02165 [Candidatus Gracilibacteria bacterium]